MKQITDTGIRGYLKWLREDQPGIYEKVAAKIAQAVPQAFSDREQSVAQSALMGLADAADPNSDVSDAANSGTSSPDVGSIINNIVTTAGQAYQTYEEAKVYDQINQAQLARAQLGLPPSAISTSAHGIPFIQGSVATAALGGSSGTTLVLVAVAALLLLTRGGGHRAAAA